MGIERDPNSDSFLSVIIPVFNEQATIRQLVERVAQALEGVTHEIVLIDDGSTDGTSREIERLRIVDCGLGRGLGSRLLGNDGGRSC